MSPELLDKAIAQSFQTRHAAVTFEWTGGESFLVGIDFYRQVAESQERYASKGFTNTVQTSGYLFDKALIDFLVEHRFHISLTIDGPEAVHDFNRPAPRGKPSLHKILTTRDYIVERQGSCGAIVTITKRSLGREGEILDLFRSLGISYFHSNPYIYFDGHRVKEQGIALTNEDYATYFINQFNAWFEQGQRMPTPVTLDYALKCLSTGSGLPNALCTFGGRCLTNFIAIAPNGDAYPCPKFIGMKAMLLGNIGGAPMGELLSDNSLRMERLIADRVAAMNGCEEIGCNYLYLCNGGCPYYSLVAGGGKDIRSRDRLCGGKMMLFSYLDGVIASCRARS